MHGRDLAGVSGWGGGGGGGGGGGPAVRGGSGPGLERSDPATDGPFGRARGTPDQRLDGPEATSRAWRYGTSRAGQAMAQTVGPGNVWLDSISGGRRPLTTPRARRSGPWSQSSGQRLPTSPRPRSPTALRSPR